VHCITLTERLHDRHFQEQFAEDARVGHGGRALAVELDEAEAAAAVLVAGEKAVKAGGGDGGAVAVIEKKKILFIGCGVDLRTQLGIVEHEAGKTVEEAENQLGAIDQVAPLLRRIEQGAQDGAEWAVAEDHVAFRHTRGEEVPAVAGESGLGEEVMVTGDGGQ